MRIINYVLLIAAAAVAGVTNVTTIAVVPPTAANKRVMSMLTTIIPIPIHSPTHLALGVISRAQPEKW